MAKVKIEDSLKQSIRALKIADNEINRPHKDVVAISVCLTARQSMSAMMRLFLLTKSINHDNGQSLSDLLNQCKKVDKQFESIELNKMVCNGLNAAECENKYCLSTESVTNCIATANQLKLIVMNKLQFSESEID